LKEFFYSDLSKIKADHFWSLKVCLEAKNQRFCNKMEGEIICENFEYRIQIIRKLRLFSSHYLVFQKKFTNGKYNIAP
jgi:hypothetical protein